VWQAADWLARLPLTHQAGGYANLGVFTAALSWSILVIFLPQQISAPNFPILASLFSAGDSRGFVRTAQTVWLACAGLSIVTAIPLIFLSKHILGLYGAEYLDGWPVMMLLTLTFAVNGTARVPAHVLIVAGLTWLHCLFTFLWGAMLCIIAILLREHGATGLALAYLAAHVVYLLLHSTACLRVLNRVQQRNSLHASS
jgi:O-antigen/teichoic acid export membrane protein